MDEQTANLYAIVGALAAIFLLIALIFQPSEREIMDSWMGAHESEVIAAWGPPDRIAEDGKGGKILIYEQIEQRASPSSGKATIRTYDDKAVIDFQEEHGAIKVYRRAHMFYLNEYGYVYYWMIR
ncbi:MAG: hypothetical protein FJY67_04730 [Calditrichaeota bacterium]|nr:hypothetical protein [Calditrichota bacterium]